MSSLRFSYRLGLRVGEIVQVRGLDEILSTLDDNGKLDCLPFMPEMQEYCGRQFRVYRRVHKTCDTIVRDGIRSMRDTVLLEGLRCNGQYHGGCEAECMLFWKEAWLKRLQPDKPASSVAKTRACTIDVIYERTRIARPDESEEDAVYSCQATEMRKSTKPLSGWRLGQYYSDLFSGNVSFSTVFRGLFIWLLNLVQSYRSGAHYPFIEGKLDKTPAVKLGLQPGELVQVLPRTEILTSLDTMNRNRGLTFDREMVRYCEGIYRVRRRVNKLLNEKTGQMINIKADCIVLENVVCTGALNRFCPRSVFPMWKETWLRRVAEGSATRPERTLSRNGDSMLSFLKERFKKF